MLSQPLICPACGSENIVGVEQCGSCQQSLTELSLKKPRSSVEASLLRDVVGDLPVHAPLAVMPQDTVAAALSAMDAGRVGCVVVSEGDRMIGIFTERDALVRLSGDLAVQRAEPISKYMTAHPARIAASDKIAFAIHQMELGGYRHLPVMEGERCVSVISIRDILRYLTERITDGAA